MEHNSPEKIVTICEQLIKLLNENDEVWWAGALKDLMNNYINLTRSKNKKEAILLIENSILGGMGSFGDLILHKDGIPLNEENDQLKALRSQLFKECELIHYGRLSTRLTDTFKNQSYSTFEADEYDYIFYRKDILGKPFGKFLIGTKNLLELAFNENQAPLPLRPKINPSETQKYYKITVPKGTVIQFDCISNQILQLPENHTQFYISKPWAVQEIEVIQEE